MTTHFEVYQDEADEFRWRLVAGNGQIVAVAGESFSRRHDAWRSAHDMATWVSVASFADEA